MNTKQTFIGAYTRNRRGAARPDQQPSADAMPEAAPSNRPDPIPDAFDRVEPAFATPSADASIFEALSVADTAVQPSQLWIDQPDGQVFRIDSPADDALAGSIPIAKTPVVDPTVDEKPIASVDRETAPAAVAAPSPTLQPAHEPAAQRTSPETKTTDVRWAGADWEVDGFDIPHSVADLFFEESFFRSVAQQLGDSVRTGLHSILVTSLGRGAGRSTVTIGTAIAAAATGLKVALIDADLNAPNQSEMLRLEIDADWVSAIRQDRPIESSAIVSIEDGVTLIPLLNSDQDSLPINSMEIDQLLSKIKDCFDLVIIDGSSIDCWSTSHLASTVDACLIVRDARSSEPSDIAIAADILRRQGVNSIGVVDNFCG